MNNEMIYICAQYINPLVFHFSLLLSLPGTAKGGHWRLVHFCEVHGNMIHRLYQTYRTQANPRRKFFMAIW
jgi:hypothetical protein